MCPIQPGVCDFFSVNSSMLNIFKFIFINCVANHKAIFGNVGLEVRDYVYYDPKTLGLNIDGLLETLKVFFFSRFARFVKKIFFKEMIHLYVEHAGRVYYIIACLCSQSNWCRSFSRAMEGDCWCYGSALSKFQIN